MAANVVTSAPSIRNSKTMDAKMYHTSAEHTDGDDVQQVVVPAVPVESETSAVLTDGGSGNLQAASGEGKNTNLGETTGNPGGSGEMESTGQPDGTLTAENPVSPEDMNHSGSSDSSEGSESTQNPVQSENPGSSENGDGEENTDNPGESENPDDSDHNGDAENPDQPGNNSGDAENPDQSGDVNGGGDTENPDQSGDVNNSGDAENPNQPQEPAKPEKPSIPNAPVVPEKPGQTDDVKPSWPLDPKSGTGGNVGSLIEDVKQFQPEQISAERIKNASLVIDQKLVKLPKLVEDHRFWTVARKYAFAKENLIIRESVVSEDEEEESIRAVGKLRKNGLLYILKEEANGWLYVESGRVRGFVRSEEIITGEEANPQLEAYQKKAKEKAEKLEQEYTGIEGTAPMAREQLSWKDNEAFTYLRATVSQTVVEKKYALTEKEAVEVMEEKDETSRVTGIIPEGGLCYILEDEGEDWVYVESGNVRGFVKNDSIRYGEEVDEQIQKEEEDHFSQAEEIIKPDENKACYYTLTSTKSGVPSGEIRRSMVEFAAQFVGNQYVWGGTSLTEGADCSGFVQSVYKQYGYDLPRVSQDQAQYGTKIPVEDALPGDLIFYAKNGRVYHVVMYAGDGKTIEAMSTDTGIVQADVSKENAVWATRVLTDNEYAGGGIGEVNATEDMYGKNLGTFKLTYYCACELCCDVETGITATGAPVVEGRTIAVDPRVIPYGTQVIIGGHVFTAEDCGGAIKENHIDIYVNDHATALALGVNYADVYLKK